MNQITACQFSRRRFLGGVVMGSSAIAFPQCAAADPLLLMSTLQDPTSGGNRAKGCEFLLETLKGRDLCEDAIAYILATVWHETAGTLSPVYERGTRDYFTKYENRTSLGNTKEGDGYLFRGRGYVQLTGRRNYRCLGDRLDLELEQFPDLALQPSVAAQILITGMVEGLFTGHALGRYITPVSTDFVAARAVVNGSDRAVIIAAYAEQIRSFV